MSLVPPRRYWLTGASSGIGAALAVELLNSGAHVALSSRSKGPLEAFAQRYPGQVLVVAGDLTTARPCARSANTSARSGVHWTR